MLWRALIGSTAVALTVSVASPLPVTPRPRRRATGRRARRTRTQGDLDGGGQDRFRHLAQQAEQRVVHPAEGRTSEVFYPDLSTPSVRSLELVVTGPGFTDRESTDMTHSTVRPDPRSLRFTETNTDKQGRYRIVETFVTDTGVPRLPSGSASSLWTGHYRLYALYDPSLANTGMDDSGRTSGHTLVASDATTSVSPHSSRSPQFGETSTGYLGTSDGWTDLTGDQRLDHTFRSAGPGNIVQIGRFTGVTGRPGTPQRG